MTSGPGFCVSGFCVSGATAAFLDYLGAKRPELPRIQLYFELPGTLVGAAGRYDVISDWYVVEDVVREVELRLGECYVTARRKLPIRYFAEWDLETR